MPVYLLTKVTWILIYPAIITCILREESLAKQTATIIPSDQISLGDFSLDWRKHCPISLHFAEDSLYSFFLLVIFSWAILHTSLKPNSVSLRGICAWICKVGGGSCADEAIAVVRSWKAHSMYFFPFNLLGVEDDYRSRFDLMRYLKNLKFLHVIYV